jgi:hypothetical protein
MEGLEIVPPTLKVQVELAVEAQVNEMFSKLQSLASFYPKFSYDGDDNGKATHEAQSRIRCSLESGTYQVRVSPKHSGSLVLWNICEDFFQAKNSAGNLFTEISQVILVNTIASFCTGDTQEEKLLAAKHKMALMRQECYGLCVGMEVVSRAMTGDHGDKPLLNYAVVTSVCCLNQHRFFTASEVTAFCIKWGLIWNEAYIILSPDKYLRFCVFHAEQLVHGTESSVSKGLRVIADRYIPAVPHDLLQGELLEGLVVRLEPRESTCIDASRALSSFYPDTLVALSAELDEKWAIAKHEEPTFRDMLRPEIDAFWGENRLTKMTQAESNKSMQNLMDLNFEGEIADFLRFLLKDPKCAKGIQYHGYHLGERVFFILHVLYDEVFAHYNKNKPPGLMPLYRGFSFWVGKGHMEEFSSLPEVSAPMISCMYKVKFMPYMIRTFIMRNRGVKLCSEGPMALPYYEAGIDRYFKAWCTTQDQLADAVKTYRTYLVDWGRFLCSRMASGDFEPLKKGYLSLIPVFEEWRQTKSDTQGTVKGAVIVVTYSSTIPEGPDAPHNSISAGFRNTIIIYAWMKDIHNTIAKAEIKSYVAGGSTVIIVASITNDGVIKGLEEALSPVLLVSWWIHCGHGADLTSIHFGKGKSLVLKWHGALKKVPNKIVPSSLTGEILQPFVNFEFLNSPQVIIDVVLQLIYSAAEPRSSTITAIIMPLIPGSGKSSLTCSKTVEQVAKRTNTRVHFFDGDDPSLREKYWSKLRTFIGRQPLYGEDVVIICSKNAPPKSYDDTRLFYERDLKDIIPSEVQVLAILPDDRGTRTHPFSLEFLLLCISRVVKRTAETHKTLHGVEAFRVVTNFYNMYADMPRENLVSSLEVLTKGFIHLPLVSQETKQMPEELVSLLERCIQNVAAVTTDEMMAALTKEEHKSYIASLSVHKEVCSESFITQIADFVRQSKGQAKEAPIPKYVGVFFTKTEQEVLRHRGCQVQDPHITVWHSSHGRSIETIRDHVGKVVTVSCDALLRSPTQLALRVVSMSFEDGSQVPCQNYFAHITMVCPRGEAHKSNDLPRLVNEGSATIELLSGPLVLNGEIKEKK